MRRCDGRGTAALGALEHLWRNHTVHVMSHRTMTELKRVAPAPASSGRSSDTSRGSPTTCVTLMLRRFTQPSKNSVHRCER